jgi:hypothetical protein
MIVPSSDAETIASSIESTSAAARYRAAENSGSNPGDSADRRRTIPHLTDQMGKHGEPSTLDQSLRALA